MERIPKEQTIALRTQHIGPSCTLFFKQNPLKMVQGQGQYMFDENGERFLDCINNVSHVGHANPIVTAAASQQMSKIYTNSRYLHDNLVLYAKRLTSYFPSSLSVCYFVNSGSEANDLAIRLARTYTGHKDVVCLDGAYHGWLTTVTEFSPFKWGNLKNHKKKKWSHVAPLPCSYRGKFTRDEYNEEEIASLYAHEVTKIVSSAHDDGRKVAAFIHESMVSCGGQVVLPNGYLSKVYQTIREAGGVCIADEVQVGFGRVGTHMWAFQAYSDNVVPDIVTLGKPIGNGHPIAAVITTPEIAREFEVNCPELFPTYGGNAVSIAVASAVLDIIEKEQLQEHAHEIGSALKDGLERMKLKYKFIGDVRGAGLFLGIDLVKSPLTKEASGEIASYVVRRCREEKVIISTEGKLGNVIKFKPPMPFNRQNVNELLHVFDMIFTEVDKIYFTSTSTSTVSSSTFDEDDESDARSSCSSSSSLSR